MIEQKLLELWSLYGVYITPLIDTTIAVVIILLSSKLKKRSIDTLAKEDATIRLLTSISNRENVKPEINAMGNRVGKVENNLVYMASMFNTAFQSSSLPEETKLQLNALSNNIQFGEDFTVIKDLKEENNKLKQELEIAKKEKHVKEDVSQIKKVRG